MWLESPLQQRLRRLFSAPRLLRPAAALSLLTGIVCGAGALHAADATWSGPTGTQAWATDANWTPATAPGATSGTTNGDTATFNSATTGTLITIDPGRNIKSLVFATGASGGYTIGSAGANAGEILLLSSGGTIVVNAGVNVPVTLNAPLVIGAPSGGGNATYTFENNSTTSTNPNKFTINGSISGGVGSGMATLNFRGTAGSRSDEINTANIVSGLISNGGATSLSVNVFGLSGGQSGVWRFTNDNNSYSGATSVSNGTLVFGSIADSGTNSAIGSGSSLVIGANTHVKYTGGAASTNRTISGSGAFYSNGTGALTLTGTVVSGFLYRGGNNFIVESVVTGTGGVGRTDAGTVFLNNNNNTFTGDIGISDGAIRVGTVSNNGTASAIGTNGRIVLGQGSSTVGRFEYTGVSASTDRLIVMRNDTAGQSGRGIIDSMTAGETLTFTNGVRTNVTGSGAAAAAIANIAELTLRGVGNGAIQGQIGGTTALPGTATALKLFKDGTGTWTLSGANNYTRETTITGGVLNIRNSSALGAVMSNEASGSTAAGAGTTVGNNATLQLQGGISVGAELLTLSGTGASGQTGALVNVSETNNFAGTVILAANTTIASDSGRLNLTSATALNGSAASRTLTLGGAGDGSITAGLGSNISTLTKTGAGLWTVGGTLAHTGATTVSAGTLNITGSISGSGLVTVANTGTFAHAGTLAGGLTVANGGALSIGNAEIAGSTGTLTVTGATVLNSTSILRMDLGTSRDLLVANGALTLDGVLSITKGAGFAPVIYKVVDYAGTLTDNGLSVSSLVGYDAVLSVDTVNQDVNLILTDIAGQYWDGGDTAADGIVDGGSGVWTNAGNNWTNANGSTNTTWAAAFDKVAFFEGATGGTVTVQDAVSVAGLQFGKDYTLAAGGGSIQITSAATEVRVTSGTTATIGAAVQGAGGINKTGEGTLVFTGTAGANSYSGPTLVTAGILKIGTTNSLPSTALTIGAGTTTVGLLTSVATLDLTSASQQLTSLQIASNSSSNNIVTIGAGQTLSVTGSGGFKVGIANTAKAETRVVFNGGGALVVDNVAANFESGLQGALAALPGGNAAFDNSANTNFSLTDLSALGSFTANVNEVRVGYGVVNTSVLTLSNTSNTITANAVQISNTSSYNAGSTYAGVGKTSLILGAGTNVISTDTLNIGVSKGDGTLKFASQTAGSAGTLVLGGKSTALVNISVGSFANAGTGATPAGTLDLRGHLSTVTAGDLFIGKRTVNGNGGSNGNVFFDTGTFTANNVEIGYSGGSSVGNSAGVLTVSGGTFTVDTGGRLVLGTHANATTAGSATATLTISGGTFISNVDILEGGGTNSTTANTVTTLRLSGGTLDMTGKNIGDATNSINNITLESGTLKDVGEINGGAALTKTTTGTLIVQGNNGFAGGITASAGTLLVSNTPATTGTDSATGSGNVSIASNATLGGNGRIIGNVTLAAGATLAPGANATTIAAGAPPPGLGTDTGTLVIAGTLDVGANANLAFNLKTHGTHGLTATFDPVTNLLTGVSGTSLDGGNDRLIVQAANTTFDPTATITVTLGSGYTGGYQDVFDLMDWAGVTLDTSYYDNDGNGTRTGTTADNNAHNLDLPDLTAYGWFWDVSQFGARGVIAIVPEPGRATLTLFGLAGLLLRRWRRPAP